MAILQQRFPSIQRARGFDGRRARAAQRERIRLLGNSAAGPREHHRRTFDSAPPFIYILCVPLPRFDFSMRVKCFFFLISHRLCSLKSD